MIAYLRVSTQKQGASGLGLDAQRATIKAYAARTGQPIEREVIEVETATGKKDRPGLALALAEAKKLGCPIVTAKLDRLARSVHAVCAIQQAGVKFIALDLPETENPLFLYVMAALAEYEARLISERTKAALAAKVAGGWVRPRSEFPEHNHKKGPFVCWAQAVAREQGIAGYIDLMHKNGMSTRAIAQCLNKEGHRTVNGNEFDHSQVRRILRRRREATGGSQYVPKKTRRNAALERARAATAAHAEYRKRMNEIARAKREAEGSVTQ